MKYLNQSIKRVDARDKVTGRAKYPGDFHSENQLILKVVFAERPHAIIHSMDTSEAEKLPGVVTVLTAADVPVNEYGLQVKDQPVLCGPGSQKIDADHVRFIGDQVACVIAEDYSIATKASELIKIEWEDLPVITDPIVAKTAGGPEIHPETKHNICWYDRVRKGNVEEAFKQAEVIIEHDYETPVQEHAYLQPEAGMAYLDEENRITVVISGQWTHEDQGEIAHALAMPEDEIRVIYPAIGGAFGGREDMSLQIVLALAVKKLKELGIERPVKSVWSREESIIGHGKRHNYKIHSKWGAMRDGKIIASETKIIADAGAYMYTSNKVMGNAILVCNGPYEIPNVSIDAYAVYTNNIPGAAFRGFGGPQGAFAGEMQMNHLAEALGMDPVEVRMKNIYQQGSLINVNTPIPDSIFAKEVLADCAGASGWMQEDGAWKRNTSPKRSERNDLKRGLGIASGFKNIGFSYGYGENCWATIELFGDKEIEKVILRHAAAEVGQGAHTAIKQMTAEALGVDIDIIDTDYSDTGTSNSSGSVSASRMTFMSGNSVKQAADIALHKWKIGERPVKVTHQYLAPQTSPLDPETGYCMPNFCYAYAAESVDLTVDTETGEIKINKVIISDDVGKAVNPEQVVGQIEGCTVQAQGYVMMENFIQEEGYTKTNRLSTYLIPTVMDIPEEMDSRILEYPDQYGPWGVKGVGELPYMALAPAIMAAIHDATGVWFHDFPLTPERVLRGLGKL
jgi:CO/xanthine dehydrogenase Mo-binding subunit